MSTKAENPPQQSALRYRLDRHSGFLQRMLAALPAETVSGRRPLAGLRAAAPGDFGYALVDGFAAVADVLCFYQERIANEGFLRTAVAGRSIYELARAAGYSLIPGVAATTHLAFVIEDVAGEGSPARVPPGTRVQSIPSPEQPAQIFETVSAEPQGEEVRSSWNALSLLGQSPPRLTLNGAKNSLPNVKLNEGTVAALPVLYLRGTALNLRPGDPLLLLDRQVSPPVQLVVNIRTVEPENSEGRTRLTLVPEPDGSVANPLLQSVPQFPVTARAASLGPQPLTREVVRGLLSSQTQSEEQLQSTIAAQSWDPRQLLELAAAQRRIDLTESTVEVYAFRQRLGSFGHNRTGFGFIPTRPSSFVSITDKQWADELTKLDSNASVFHLAAAAPPIPWPHGAHLALERSVPEVTAGGWVLLRDAPDGRTAAFEIERSLEASFVATGSSGRATGLVLRNFPPNGLETSGTTPFNFRSTTLFVQSERLPLAPLPVLSPVTGQDLVLASMTLGLRPGRAVWISGELLDDPGVKRSEIRTLTAVSHHQGLTALELHAPLSYRYRRETVRINANVVLATHGEGGDFEILGSGDINQPNQRFALRRSGLAFQPQRDGQGIHSGVEVLVAGVPWREVPTLFGQAPDAAIFVVHSDLDGGSEIVFGDGVNGSRLPTGRDNLRVRYRVAKTAQGGVEAESLSLLRSHPLGVRSVKNPLAADGQASPPTLAELRQAAPVQTQLLNRLVSLQDYEQYAATFPGIGKARADLITTEIGRSVLITVIGSDGQEASPALLKNLTRSAAQLGDPLQGLRLITTRPQFFRVRAGLVTTGSATDNAPLLSAAQQALITAFSVAGREFAQDVGVSEVIRVLQSVPGVIAALLDDFNLTTAGQRGVVQLLSSSSARANRRGRDLEIQPATLLLIHPLEIQLYSVTP